MKKFQNFFKDLKKDIRHSFKSNNNNSFMEPEDNEYERMQARARRFTQSSTNFCRGTFNSKNLDEQLYSNH